MDNINCEYTDEIICPHCGYEYSDSWEYGSDSEDIGLEECPECEKGFYATRRVEITYSTEKATYGTCLKCGKSETIIEDYHSSIGKYEELCIECGNAEKLEFHKRTVENYKKNK